MYGDDRKTIEHVAELVEENNVILHRLQRSKRWKTFFHILYWLVALLLAAGLYYYVQPYVESLKTVLPQLEQTINSLPLPGWSRGQAPSPLPR